MTTTRDALGYDVGDLVAGRYRITGILGRGGFGAVYAGQHLGTAQPVAIKMLQAAAHDSHSEERFYREARLTAKLTHANTVRVFDVGRDAGGPPYLVMEMLRGPTLEAVLQGLAARQRPMSEAEASQVAIAILGSLHEAHSAGLVHRDLKPANVMFQRVPGLADRVKVLDFGCAHSVDSELTREGQLIGTPSYMSPEQCTSSPVDARADLYALGVILFRCVALRLPFADQNVLTLLYKHASEPPPLLEDCAPQPLHRGFTQIVHKALAKEPADRFSDAREMRQALESYLKQVTPLAIDVAAAESGQLLAQVIDAALAETEESAPTLAATVPYQRTVDRPEGQATVIQQLEAMETFPELRVKGASGASRTPPPLLVPDAFQPASGRSLTPPPMSVRLRSWGITLGVLAGVALLILATLLLMRPPQRAGPSVSSPSAADPRLAAPRDAPPAAHLAQPDPPVPTPPAATAGPGAAAVAPPPPEPAVPAASPVAAPQPPPAAKPKTSKKSQDSSLSPDPVRPRVQPRLVDD